MRANFEIWGDEDVTPSPDSVEEPELALKSLVAATTGLFLTAAGPVQVKVQPEEAENCSEAALLAPEEPFNKEVSFAQRRRATSESNAKDVLHTISRTINKTHASLKRSRLIHAFYILSLPLYTILGALIFMYLDGEYDDEAIAKYESRCNLTEITLNSLMESCGDYSVSECKDQIRNALLTIDVCFRSRSYEQWPTHSMSNFANSIVYATSVYTTIGYGNIAAETYGCRIATVIYAVIGIPLFFAFLKDMGQLFSVFFIKGWRAAGHLKQRLLTRIQRFRSRNNWSTNSEGRAEEGRPPDRIDNRTISKDSEVTRVQEQRRVFLWAVIFFLIYLILVSFLFCLLEEKWDFFIAFYFLFTSVALIGFGDVFPKNPNIVLINFAFIVLGIVLFGMCYFILQEEIREKAFQASRRVRNSIFKYHQKKKFSLSTAMNGTNNKSHSRSPENTANRKFSSPISPRNRTASPSTSPTRDTNTAPIKKKEIEGEQIPTQAVDPNNTTV